MPTSPRASLAALTALTSLVALAGCAVSSSDDAASIAQDVSRRDATTTRLRDGKLVVTMRRPAFVSSCTKTERCDDADHDGLVDDWEDALLDRLRPRMALHPEEPLLEDPEGRFGYVARVFRPENGPSDVVRVILVTGFSYDPGVLLFGKIPMSAHDGDSERVAVELKLTGNGREATLNRAYFAVHEHTINDQSRLYAADELDRELTLGRDAGGEPRWVVFPSKGKHPEFANPAACAATSLHGTGLFREHCAASEAEGHALLPPVVNAGEPAHHRADDLAIVGFAGDDAWAEQKFCGGFREQPRLGACAESVASKLHDDPFAPAP